MPLRVYNRSINKPMQASSLLVIANGAVYAACAWESGRLRFNPTLMLRWGAISHNTLINSDYWRIVAAGFLHFDLLHLLFNMTWIIYFGSILEKRIGTTYFLTIYGTALIFGNIFITLAQPGLFAGAGASGAVSGIMGALVCLQVLGKPAMSAQTLITNLAVSIGFNVALASSVSWRGHLGGFAAGLIACAVLDLVERFNRVWLSCKFPEFVKLNLAAVLPVGAWLCWAQITGRAGLNQPIILAMLTAAMMIGIKLIDLLLARKNGLVMCILALALGNMAIVFKLALSLIPGIASFCAPPRSWFGAAGTWGQAVAEAGCARPSLDAAALGYAALLLTVLLLIRPLKQGLEDVGFVPEGFRAARRRIAGL